jgi:DNA-binding NarL/FixJ family response regulator
VAEVRVLLVDNHTIVRAGLRVLLETLPGLVVVAEASDGREALRLAALHRPDLVLMDIAMPEMNGLEATERLRREFPQIQVVILSMHAHEEYVLQALRLGARGYILKDAGTAELELAIAAVRRGETYLSPAVSRHVIDQYLHRVGGAPEPPPIEPLTPRQREVLQLIAEGRTNKEIADVLQISVKTVETHRMQLMQRLGIHDLAGLVRYAVRSGLIYLET